MKRKYLDMAWYNDFKCIGGDCPLTCCTSDWHIDLLDEEIEKYEQLDHPLAQEILQAIDKEKKTFKSNECGYCKMLTEDGWCRIVRECGEEYIYSTCSIFPRDFISYGDVYERFVSMSCPEAVLRLFQDAEVLFDLNERETDEEIEAFDYESYDAFAAIRNVLIEMWQYEDALSDFEKYFFTIAIYFHVMDLEEKHKFGMNEAEKVIKELCNFSEHGILAEQFQLQKPTLENFDLRIKLIHFVFAKTGDEVLTRLSSTKSGLCEIEILNHWLVDQEQFKKDLESYLEYFRKKFTSVVRNYFIYSLFSRFFERKEGNVAGAKLSFSFMVKCIEWMWIQIIAATVWLRSGEVGNYPVLIAELERFFDHSLTMRRDMIRCIQEMNFDQVSRMFMIVLF